MRTPQPSRVPEVVDAVLALADAYAVDEKAAGRAVAVLDGPSPKSLKGDVIAVGVGENSVIVENVVAQGMAIHYTETVDVVCNLWSWTGATKRAAVKGHRDRCGDMLAALVAKMRDDPTLDGVCDQAVLGESLVWQQENDSAGASCAVGFTVRVKSNI